jgi:hypothetical protein
MNREVRAVRSPWGAGVQFLIRQGSSIAEPLIMRHQKTAGEIIEPTFELDMNEAQALMDDLWHCGLRPTEGTGSAGALAATQKHLEDMRTLVFKTGGIPK